jgi:hypothetical protein
VLSVQYGEYPQNHEDKYPKIPRTLVSDARYRSRGTHALRLAPVGDDIAVANDQPARAQIWAQRQSAGIERSDSALCRFQDPASRIKSPPPSLSISRKLVTLKARERTDLKRTGLSTFA